MKLRKTLTVGGKEAVDLDEKFFTSVTTTGAKVFQGIPVLRAGVLLNGKRVKSLQLCGHEMVVSC